MRKIIFVFCLSVIVCFLCFLPAQARINIVTSTPDLKDIAQRIGGSNVTVTSIAKGYQDPHFVEPKPSYMLLLKKADLYLVMGMSLESGWSPSLEQGSRNASVMRGSAGYVDCSAGITPIEVPQGGADRSMGDVHPNGNPHYQLDPDNARIIAKNIAAALIRKDPSSKALYESNLSSFDKAVVKAEIRWLTKMKPYKGMKVVTDHKMWSYFAKRFGLDVVATIEPKPGISPSPSHIAKVISLIKEQDVKLIIRTPYFDAKVPDMIARNTGVKNVVLPSSVGGVDGIDDYFSLFDYITDSIVKSAAAK